MGATKKPWMMHLAIHSPLLDTYALRNHGQSCPKDRSLDGIHLQILVP
jgi:hypothetical protein